MSYIENEYSIDVNDFLDERNRELWEDVCANHNVSIKEAFEDNYGVYIKEDESIIYVLSNEKCPASFTHELLHIWLSIKKYSPGNYIKGLKYQEDKLRMVFSNELVEHIENVLEHRKMLPKFIEMGYKRSDFLSDYSKYKMNDVILSEIIDKFKRFRFFKFIYDSRFIDLYIGKYFAMKCCPNPSNDYNKYLKIFKLLDCKLFNILEDFVKQWDKLIIEDEFNDCLYVMNNFCINMSKWIKRKEII